MPIDPLDIVRYIGKAQFGRMVFDRPCRAPFAHVVVVEFQNAREILAWPHANLAIIAPMRRVWRKR